MAVKPFLPKTTMDPPQSPIAVMWRKITSRLRPPAALQVSEGCVEHVSRLKRVDKRTQAADRLPHNLPPGFGKLPHATDFVLLRPSLDVARVHEVRLQRCRTQMYWSTGWRGPRPGVGSVWRFSPTLFCVTRGLQLCEQEVDGILSLCISSQALVYASGRWELTHKSRLGAGWIERTDGSSVLVDAAPRWCRVAVTQGLRRVI